MEPRYRLHYAPDNASLIVRLALHELDVPFETELVDRTRAQQRSKAYRALNPAGLIPALETPDGVIFETAAILLWLADTHGALAPPPEAPARASFLKWLFFMSNTVHPALRMMFYPHVYIGDNPHDQAHLRRVTGGLIQTHLQILDAHWQADAPLSVLDLYLCPMLRWCAIYPKGYHVDWFDLSAYPELLAAARKLETRASTLAAQTAEGLGQTPFTAPRAPNPPEGSAV